MSEEKKTNPLYVVNEEDNTVEEATNFFDFILKKLNLEPFIEAVWEFIQALLEGISSYPIFMEIKKFIDQTIEQLEVWVENLSASKNH